METLLSAGSVVFNRNVFWWKDQKMLWDFSEVKKKYFMHEDLDRINNRSSIYIMCKFIFIYIYIEKMFLTLITEDQMFG